MNNNVNINPLDNMYQFVNQKWLNETVLPADKTSINSFDVLADGNILKQKIIYENFIKSDVPIHNKLGKIYERLNNLDDDMSGLEKYINIIKQSRSINDIFKLIGSFHKLSIFPFFVSDAQSDPLNSEVINLTVYPSDLCFPDRDYYLKPEFEKYVNDFKTHLSSVFNILHDANIVNVDEHYEHYDHLDILEIESMLSLIHRSSEEKREIKKYYSKTTLNSFVLNIAESIEKHDDLFTLKNDTIKMIWDSYFKSALIDNANSVVIFDMNFFRRLTIMLMLVPIHMIQSYLIYIFVKNIGSLTIAKLDTAFFDFYGKVVLGQKKQKPRHEKTIMIINNVLKLGEITGKVYVEQYFSEDAKKMVLDMVDLLMIEMQICIKNCDWMTDVTKENALLKLSKFKVKIGYPDKWYDFTSIFNSIDFAKENIIEIILKFKKFNYVKDVLNKIDKPIDNTIWHMDPHEVNAYYDQSLNEIVFPAGILQSPFFDVKAPAYFNFGGIGVVIGHEITHGFDDKGREYDHNANLFNWWTKEDEIKFDERAGQIIAQYDEYSVDVGDTKLNINGKLTQGENIADLGGVILSYRGMQKYYKKVNKEINQNFFIKFADIWKSKMSKQRLTDMLLSNPHSPGEYRVAILRNVDAFYEAFEEYENKNRNNPSLYLDANKRIKIWS